MHQRALAAAAPAVVQLDQRRGPPQARFGCIARLVRLARRPGVYLQCVRSADVSVSTSTPNKLILCGTLCEFKWMGVCMHGDKMSLVHVPAVWTWTCPELCFGCF